MTTNAPSVSQRRLGALFDPKIAVDPYPYLNHLRENAPLFWDPDFKTWVVSRYADCVSIFQHSLAGASTMMPVPPDADPAYLDVEKERDLWRSSLVFLNPPEHTRVRGLISKLFTPRMVEEMRPQIQTLVNTLLDEVAARGTMDLVRELAYPIPALIVARMLGIADVDLDKLKLWSKDAAISAYPQSVSPQQIRVVASELREYAQYVRDILKARRRTPGDDLISHFVRSEHEQEHLNEEELLAHVIVFLTAGSESSTSLIAGGIYNLLTHPDQLEKLRKNPALIKPAVAEMLRFISPVLLSLRVARADMELGGQAIKAGETFTLLLAAANRDPARFPDPDRFDITRIENRHLAFAHGIHHCIGAPLAELEAQITVQTLLHRFPRLALGPTPPSLGITLPYRTVTSFPVQF